MGVKEGKVPINIHGREYMTVAERINDFRGKYPIDAGWCVETRVDVDDGTRVVMVARILNPEGVAVGVGHAEERRDSSQINRTSCLENCETSALGRALASCGFGGSEYASANEVENAVHQQAQNGPQTAPRPSASAGEGREAKIDPEALYGAVVDVLATAHRELVRTWAKSVQGVSTAKAVRSALQLLVHGVAEQDGVTEQDGLVQAAVARMVEQVDA